ncbi:hypothetical protein PAMA_016542 [Pampus argenteus]
MFASWPGNMRGPRIKTPVLLLLLLLTNLTGTVLCQYDDDAKTSVTPTQVKVTELLPSDASSTSTTPSPGSTDPDNIEEQESSGMNSRSINSDVNTVNPSLVTPTKSPKTVGGLIPTIILIPVVLVVVIITIIVCCIFIKRRWNIKADLRKEDPYLDGPSTEKVPMPMFEEDVPSVLELEMEELDQWMKKDGETAEDSTQA